MNAQGVEAAMEEGRGDRRDHIERGAGVGNGAADGGDNTGGNGEREEGTDAGADEAGDEVEEESVEGLVEYGTHGEAGGGEGGPHGHARVRLDDGAMEGGGGGMGAEVDLGESIAIDLVRELNLRHWRYPNPLHSSCKHSCRSQLQHELDRSSLDRHLNEEQLHGVGGVRREEVGGDGDEGEDVGEDNTLLAAESEELATRRPRAHARNRKLAPDDSA
mmetsp:Transcript_48342/g.151592  ORF Transcript_48342/g.151592 Transcript_48342/m.151592 type:complete len:218 (+) Transcript_48342:343-996(+)